MTQVRAASTASSQLAKPSSSSSTTPEYLSFPDFTPLPRPHGLHVATLHLRSHHVGPLDLYTSFALHSASSLKIPTANAASLPTTRALHTVLKSPFVHKKSQENFEIRTHRRAIKVFDADRDALDRWVRYLRRNSIGGVGMKVYVKEFVEFGWADKEMEAVEGAMRGREAQADIEDAAKKIVQSIEAEGMENTLEAPTKEGQSEAPAPIS